MLPAPPTGSPSGGGVTTPSAQPSDLGLQQACLSLGPVLPMVSYTRCKQSFHSALLTQSI